MVVDLLLEKYLNAFKLKNDLIEIFVNPTAAEVREVFRASEDSVGVIMDLEEKKIYFFSRDKVIHNSAWMHIKHKDGKLLYDKFPILTAEYDLKYNKRWDFSSNWTWNDSSNLNYFKTLDWSFFKKWIPEINQHIKRL